MKHLSFSSVASGILVFGITLLLPLFFLPVWGLSLAFSKMAFLTLVLLVVAGIYLIDVLQKGALNIPRSWMYAGIGGVFFSVLIASMFSPAFPVSFWGEGNEIATAVGMLIMTGLFFVSAFLFGEEGVPGRIRKYLNISATIVFTYQIVNIIFLSFGKTWFSFGMFTSPTVSPLGGWYDLGLFAGLIVLLSMATHIIGKERVRKDVFAPIALISGLVIASLVGFSLVWMFLALAALIVIVFSMSFGAERVSLENDTESRRHSRIPVMPIVVLVISVFFLLPGSLISSVLSNIGLSYTHIRPSWSGTTDVAFSVWQQDVRSAIFGEGPNRFSSAWRMHKPVEINNTIAWNADFDEGIGFVPTFAITTGILGIVAWIVFFSLFLFLSLRGLGKISRESSGFRIGVMFFLLALYTWTTMVVYTPGIFFTALAFIFSGALVAIFRKEGVISSFSLNFAHNPKVGFIGALSTVLLLIGVVAGVYGLATRTVSAINFGSGLRVVNIDGDTEKGTARLLSAIGLYETDTYYRTLASLFVNRLYQISEGADPSTVRASFQEFLGNAIAASRRAVAYDESSPFNHASLGDVYAAVSSLGISGAYESAVLSYQTAAQHDPYNPTWHLSLARLEVGQKNIQGARAHIERALALKGDYADAVFLLSQIEASEGDIKRAITLSEETTLLAPNDVGALFQLGLLYYRDGSYTSAIAPLERALILSPDYANAKYFLGLAYANSGRRNDAIRLFEDLVKTNTENEEISSILSNLKAGLSPLSGVSPLPEEREEAPIEE